MSKSLDINELFSVKNMVAVITGGGTGLGLMFARALAHNGAARVYILGRRIEVLEAAAREGPPGVIVPIVCDVTSKAQLEGAAKQVEEESGRVNLLVANAGAVGPRMPPVKKPTSLSEFQAVAWSWSDDEFTYTYGVNATATFFTAIAFLHLLERGSSTSSNTDTRDMNVGGTSPGPLLGQIIFISSIGGFMRQPATGFAYSSSKAANIALAKTLATYMATSNFDVRVNVICPAMFPSQLTQGMMGYLGTPQDDGSVAVSTDVIPMGRFGQESDLAGTILYMASRAGAYMNGNVVVLDGGRLSTVQATY